MYAKKELVALRLFAPKCFMGDDEWISSKAKPKVGVETLNPKPKWLKPFWLKLRKEEVGPASSFLPLFSLCDSFSRVRTKNRGSNKTMITGHSAGAEAVPLSQASTVPFGVGLDRLAGKTGGDCEADLVRLTQQQSIEVDEEGESTCEPDLPVPPVLPAPHVPENFVFPESPLNGG